MISFHKVSDAYVATSGKPLLLLEGMSGTIPQGRFALLVKEPGIRKGMVDLLCGTRVPHEGSIWREGRASWPIGRQGLMRRGQLPGSDVIGLVCRIYDLDRRLAEGLVADIVTYPELISKPIANWPTPAKTEFALTLALLPRFDIYVTDGKLLVSRDRFGVIWRSLFEERIAKATLIVSSHHLMPMREFCEQALIVADGTIEIDEQLDDAITRYPPRAPAPELAEADSDSAAEEDAFE